ncbi:VWA domain-containing protein [Actinomadura sp. 3N407]|uniref:VWA domain-containing protein n=1 Tax=Actinomadura sp. 3N407 TaxID=3457423 RepID=UPI003FCDEF0C
MRKLDDLPVPRKRAIDNAAFFPAGADPRAIADSDLYDSLMDEFPSWLVTARAAGILS